MYGFTKPTGVMSRLAVLDPSGNCVEAEAARKALALYAHELIVIGTHHGDKKWIDRGEAIRNWIEQETIAAETVRVQGEMNM